MYPFMLLGSGNLTAGGKMRARYLIVNFYNIFKPIRKQNTIFPSVNTVHKVKLRVVSSSVFTFGHEQKL